MKSLTSCQVSRTQVGQIEGSAVCGSVRPHEASSVKNETHWQLLKSHILGVRFSETAHGLTSFDLWHLKQKPPKMVSVSNVDQLVIASLQEPEISNAARKEEMEETWFVEHETDSQELRAMRRINGAERLKASGQTTASYQTHQQPTDKKLQDNRVARCWLTLLALLSLKKSQMASSSKSSCKGHSLE